ncbi:MAG: ABC transporter permease [Hyphomicrobiales bacterium]|nr:ABC transporter permease [Hyphomicrobiales bacterium]
MRKPIFNPRTKIAFGTVIVVAILFVAIFAPFVAPSDPNAQDLLDRLLPPVWRQDGTVNHLLGTDAYGRDVLSRLVYGSRISIIVGVAAMMLSCVVGTVLGMLAGYKGGRQEALIMRIADAQLAVPAILLAILVVATMGGSLFNLVVVLGISSWMIYARVIFGMTKSIKELPYVEAAVSQGAGVAYTLRRHILPQLVPVLTVISTLQVAQMILTETALSFLGLGIPPPTPSWGNILAEGRDRLLVAPWIANAAGIAIVILVWGINMLGNGLREELDPKGASRG